MGVIKLHLSEVDVLSASEMTYIVSSGALNSTHSLTQVDVLALNTKLWQRGRRLYGWDDFVGEGG